MTDFVPEKRLERERRARQEAEQLLEEKSRALYLKNEELKTLAESLEAQVVKRTQELKEARDEALEVSIAKSRFIAVMSHEVRSPLNGVIGAFGLLKDTSLTAEQLEFVEAARTSASALLVIINDILDYSKIDVEKLQLEPVVFDLYELITGIIDSFGLSSHSFRDSIRIRSLIDTDAPRILIGDSARLRQVLINLISNAVKFTEKGEIQVTVTMDEILNDKVSITFGVRDTGVGISAENRTHLFEEFWSRSAKQEGGVVGTGLGLSISYRLVKLMGGEIRLKSVEGEGSFFWFTLPLQIANESALPQIDTLNSLEKETDIILSGRVLLAEDNSVNQLIISAILTKFGLTVDVVGNGIEAVESVINRSYDVILMDIDMPEMNGIEATRAINEFLGSKQNKIPIIAITAHALQGDREKFLSYGFDDYIVKPISRLDLSLTLEKLLEKDDVLASNGITHKGSVQSAPETSGIDQQTLENLMREVGGENMTMLVQVFLDELDMHTEKFKLAASLKDLEQLGMSAHSLKSSAASFGAIGLSNLARRIEEKVDQSDVVSAVRDSEKLVESAKVVRRQLQETISNQG